jgi:hypothetical protein
MSSTKQKSLGDVFRLSGPKMIGDALAQPHEGLLDSIPSCGLDGKTLDSKTSKQGVIRVESTPKPQEIDYRRTTDEMIWERTAILNDGRTVAWGD